MYEGGFKIRIFYNFIENRVQPQKFCGPDFSAFSVHFYFICISLSLSLSSDGNGDGCIVKIIYALNGCLCEKCPVSKSRAGILKIFYLESAIAC